MQELSQLANGAVSRRAACLLAIAARGRLDARCQS